VRALRVVAYYRQHWFPVTYPESFFMEKGSRIEWILPSDAIFEDAYESSDSEDSKTLVPIIAFMPDGYVEPSAEMILTFESNPISFKYSWDEDAAAITVKRLAL
jgi:hypothetical protein